MKDVVKMEGKKVGKNEEEEGEEGEMGRSVGGRGGEYPDSAAFRQVRRVSYCGQLTRQSLLSPGELLVLQCLQLLSPPLVLCTFLETVSTLVTITLFKKCTPKKATGNCLIPIYV
jgi:hypothetical protein